MSYAKTLEQHGISQADLDTLTQYFAERGKQDTNNSLPDAVYNTVALDITMGAIEFSKETLSAMGKGHDAKGWIKVMTGVDL